MIIISPTRLAELSEPIRIPLISDDVGCYSRPETNRDQDYHPIYWTILQPLQNEFNFLSKVQRTKKKDRILIKDLISNK